MANDNFCTWTDANAFMLACSTFNGGLKDPHTFFGIVQRLESPLELVMLSALKAAEPLLDFGHGSGGDFVRMLRQEFQIEFPIRAAVSIGTYRADLVMQAEWRAEQIPTPSVVIECDGFTYHDKTRDQAIRDRARDRYMQREGFVVARFTGDEIVEQPFACALEVYDLVLRGLASVRRDAHPEQGWPVFTRRNEGKDSGPMTITEFFLQVDRNDIQAMREVV